MSSLEKVCAAGISACLVALLILWLSGNFHGEPRPVEIDTDGNVGRCVQAQQVLYQSPAGAAAETCLAQLYSGGEKSFDRTWKNYGTEWPEVSR